MYVVNKICMMFVLGASVPTAHAKFRATATATAYGKKTAAQMRIKKELEEIWPPWVHSQPDAYTWRLRLPGPVGTPYEGGNFDVKVSFPTDYPFNPPQVFFQTRIYSFGVDLGGFDTKKLGWISLARLSKEHWKPSHNMAQVIDDIVTLMKNPECAKIEGAHTDKVFHMVNAEAYELFVKNREEYERIAREWTRKHAMEDGDAEIAAITCDAE